MRPKIISGRKVFLSVPTKEDMKKAWLWYNDRDVRRYLSHPEAIFFYEDEMEWYESLRREKHKERVFSVIENSSESLVGFVGLHQIDMYNRHAELGYFISKEFWGRGYATEAVRLALLYAFNWLNLRKVYARVYESNLASIRVLEKNGFVLSGRLHKHEYIPEEGFVDLLIYERFRQG
ncbi:MAG: [ribosomal protein S5]-alanine N-acetyltransferase [Thermococcaceae archaeon]|nr:[ribosomal protein S5]-alanine N-acetyltransferase [Thermococcaceae archaeon]